jgi:hypothetical protein
MTINFFLIFRFGPTLIVSQHEIRPGNDEMHQASHNKLRQRSLARRRNDKMSGDWYTQVSSVVDALARSAKVGLHTLQDSLTDLTTNIDKPLFSNAHPMFSTVLSSPKPPPSSTWDQVSSWILENRYAIMAVTGASGAGTYYIYRAHAKKHRRRRAARTGNASRKEGIKSALQERFS